MIMDEAFFTEHCMAMKDLSKQEKTLFTTTATIHEGDEFQPRYVVLMALLSIPTSIRANVVQSVYQS